jgi:hypothetical protein
LDDLSDGVRSMPTSVKPRRGSKRGVRRRPERTGAPEPRGETLPAAGGEPDIERDLDEALKGTFPASDPVALPLRAY